MNWSVQNIQGSNAQDIASSIETSLRSGELQAGDALPAVRHLATQLGVNPNTVAAAYARLRDAGRLVTSGRRGTRVAGEAVQMPAVYVVPHGLRDLASGQVDPTLLAQLRAGAWNKLRVFLAPPTSGISSPSGELGDDEELLCVTREWLQSQGIPSQSSVGVFSSTLDTIERSLRQHARPGDRVAIEDPCWPPLLALLRSLRLRPVPLPMDAQGIQVPPAGVLASCAAMVLTPRAHNPTGANLRGDRWRALRKQLRACPNTLVIFNDYWGLLSKTPFVSGGGKSGSHNSNALPPNWLYVMSLGKALGAEMRVCIAAGLPDLIDGMRAHHAIGPRKVSLWLQRFAALLWRQSVKGRGRGSFTHMQGNYAARRQALLAELHKHGVALDVDLDGEGLHLWIGVPDELTVVQAMASRGWAVQAGSTMSLMNSPGIRISVGQIDKRDAKRLAADLAGALSLQVRAVY
ncbi:aminotransferase class I/II-fold pyridoxal phosphate-dependent enzyme [Diaphorobacter sp. HDW4A]|uniref:aminotransferase class I/II-fold pyridoxal phosphate-dependent enzyme n=1 Tax=Diaphorobacter sp. HDW4A TaxID=2714924 RepID=UPI001409AF9B|nr:aminotransferase class I/II-fold pyridoxal phosphate-dependent enzyme [Diaphorobacter sp. HDW4A]QIL82535.1 aminotransferase class I/II-fold pyridoxal phosphate-dependent enzyme [Diaphorobacter sp. HDW4A]